MQKVTSSVEEPKSPLDIAEWSSPIAAIRKHPELHHYTNRAGFEGIWRSKTLWATHFADLSDSSEIVMLKRPLSLALEDPIKSFLNARRLIMSSLRRTIEERGGLTNYAHEKINDFIDAHFVTAFHGGRRAPMAEPFIFSFCSHSADHEYEKDNGLLSQWRGYGKEGRFALVFDTEKLDTLLRSEWKAHYWVRLDLANVVYFDRHEVLHSAFPALVGGAVEMLTDMLKDRYPPRVSFVLSMFDAATLLKHRGFLEEREVRIVAIPQSKQNVLDLRGSYSTIDLSRLPPLKTVHSGSPRRHIALFDSLGATLPIKRVIIGPGANQESDIEFAKTLVADAVPVTVSETPFIG